MTMIATNDASYRTAIRTSGVTLLDFHAPWCAPCKALNQVLDDLNHEFGEDVTILKVNADDNPEAAAAYGVMSLPTVIVFRDGEPIDKLVGLRPAQTYRGLIGRQLGA